MHRTQIWISNRYGPARHFV